MLLILALLACTEDAALVKAEPSRTEQYTDAPERPDTGESVDTGETGGSADTAPPPPTDADGDGYAAGVDCDDSRADVHPGAPEVCDGVDDDCDGAGDPAAPPGCPDVAGMRLTEGAGLRAIDASGFVLADEGTTSAHLDRIAGLARTLPVRSVGTVFDNGNRDADVLSRWSRATGFAWGFTWNSGDDGVDYWMPQGVTGTFDADASGWVDGHEGVVVSWHYDPDAAGTSEDRGVRLSFVDTTDRGNVTYRHVLLVTPTGTADAPNFTTVNIHAGGIAWYGPYLYVADTSRGVRVFDTRHILEVATSPDDVLGCDGSGACRAYGYRYILPQVTRYALPPCGCDATFSFVGLDRSSSPPSLVTGAYDSSSIDGVLLRWPLDPSTFLPAGAYVRASEAFVAQQDRMQGVASKNGTWWISSSSQSGSNGGLYRASASGGATTAYDWVYGAEDLAIDANHGWLWGLTEHPDNRAVFAVSLSAVGG